MSTRNRLESRDIYETEDLPEADQIYEKNEDKSIDIIAIPPSVAFNRFRGKTLDLNKRKFNKFQIRQEESLNPILKAQRIKSEIQDLKNLVSKMDDTKEITEKEPVNKEQFLQLIDGLESQLNSLDVEKQLEKCDLTINNENKLFKKLEKKVEEILKQNKSDKVKEELMPNTYKLMASKDINEKIRESTLENLSKRLTELERIIGPDDGMKLANVVSDCPNKGLLDAVERLRAKTCLLHGPELTIIESRINSVINQLKNVTSVAINAMPLDPEDQAKISELYELVKKYDSVVNQLPSIIDNCNALAEQHDQCAKTVKTVNILNDKQQCLNHKMNRCTSTINNIQKNLPENFDKLNQSIGNLDERIGKLKIR